MKELERLLPLLGTYDHRTAVPLYDSVIRDPAAAGPILQELVYVVSKHDDPQVRTPHGLTTVMAARSLLHLTRPPGGLGLLRFLVLYNFGLPKASVEPAPLEAAASKVPSATLADASTAYRKAVAKGLGDQAGALLCRISLDHGHEAAAHGIGTARAFQVSETAGAFAALAMGLNGLATALLLPLLVRLWA